MRRSGNIINPNEPREGFYLLSMTRGGWKVAARLSLSGGKWVAIVDGEIDPTQPTPEQLLTMDATAHAIGRIMLYGQECSEAEYLRRLAMKNWARDHAPNHPCLNPYAPINSFTAPPAII